MKWNLKEKEESINNLFKDIDINNINIIDYSKKKDIENIKLNEAYKIEGVHLYLQITNIEEILNITKLEGEMAHKRTLKILDFFYKIGTIVIKEYEAILVDFHNQRLHAVFVKPYEKSNEKARILEAIKCSNTIISLIKKHKKEDEIKIKVGIDSGISIAVNNGSKKHPLFLGNPANRAAKMLQVNNDKEGLFLHESIIEKMDLKEGEYHNKKNSIVLSNNYLKNIKIEEKIKEIENKIKYYYNINNNDINFSKINYPIKDLKFNNEDNRLTPSNSKRQEMVSFFADISGFTKYIEKNIDYNLKNLIIIFHVIKSEFEKVVSENDAKRVRFIGDCIHGLYFSKEDNRKISSSSIENVVNIACELRSSFELIKKISNNFYGINIDEMGLKIGLDCGEITISELGLNGEERRICVFGKAIESSEKEQNDCDYNETKIGKNAYTIANEFIKTIFNNKQENLTVQKLELLNPNSKEESLKDIQKNNLNIDDLRYSCGE